MIARVLKWDGETGETGEVAVSGLVHMVAAGTF